MTSKSLKDLFLELEEWSHRKDAYSLKDFLKEKGVSFDDFERMANSSKKFMKIWGNAESQAWENVKNALFKKSLPRSKIAEYIKESEGFQNQDPEKVMQCLESGQARLKLYETAVSDTGSNENVHALMKCSLDFGVITKEQYKDFLRIEAKEGEYSDF